MLDNLPDPQKIAAALQRAAVHWAKAGYELASGVGAFIDELVGSDDAEKGDDTKRPTRIEVD